MEAQQKNVKDGKLKWNWSKLKYQCNFIMIILSCRRTGL